MGKSAKVIGFSIAFFFIGVCIGCLVMSTIDANNLKNNEQAIIDSSRIQVIELNKKFNYYFDKVGYLALGQNDNNAMLAFAVLQELSPKLFQLNKSLKLDCTRYKDDGTTYMIRGNDGMEHPGEALPEEIKVLK